jgi:hypothetical protein
MAGNRGFFPSVLQQLIDGSLRKTPAAIVSTIDELLDTHSEVEITAILNERGHRTYRRDTEAPSKLLGIWPRLNCFLAYPELELSKAMVSYCTSLWSLSWGRMHALNLCGGAGAKFPPTPPQQLR